MISSLGSLVNSPCWLNRLRLRNKTKFERNPVSEKTSPHEKELVNRALGGTRTPNLLIRSQMLYPLSYKRWET